MAETQLLRVGKISSINYPDGTARVTYEDRDGSTTTELPFLADREYKMPEIGDQVLVGHLPNGQSRAVILGSFWYEGNRPKISGEGVYRKDYANVQGVAGETYDAKADAFTFQAGGCTIQMSGGKVTITAPAGVTVNGGITATRDVIAGSISLQNHTHAGVHGDTNAAK